MRNRLQLPCFDRFKRLSDTDLLRDQKLFKRLSGYRLLYEIGLCAQQRPNEASVIGPTPSGQCHADTDAGEYKPDTLFKTGCSHGFRLTRFH